MYFIGIDVGSTYTKYCVIDKSGQILRLFMEKTPIRQQEYFEQKRRLLAEEYPDNLLISCGYGRNNVMGHRAVNELTALAVGAQRQIPEIPLILDIGGQDTKVIRQKAGRLQDFFVNQKCAAGCGLFLKNTLDMLGMPFDEIHLGDGATSELRLSSVCAVFAQTEIVEAIAAGVSEKAILQAVLTQIFTQAKSLLEKLPGTSVALSGGLAGICGIQPFAQQILGRNIVVPRHAAYLSAIGCATLCEISEKKGWKKHGTESVVL